MPVPQQKTILNIIHNRIHKERRNVNVAIVGRPGTGKSETVMLKFMELLDPDFNAKSLKERIVFDPYKFLNLIDNKGFKRGSCIGFDEAQAKLSNKDFTQWINKALGVLMQTYRNRGYIVFYTIPQNIMLIDKGVRIFFDFEIRCTRIDMEKQEVVALINELTWPTNEEPMRNRVAGNRGTKQGCYRITRPSPEIREAYLELQEENKKQMVEELQREGAARMKEKEGKETETLFDVEKTAKELVAVIKEEYDKFKSPHPLLKVTKGKLRLNRERLERHYKISARKAYSLETQTIIELEQENLDENLLNLLYEAKSSPKRE